MASAPPPSLTPPSPPPAPPSASDSFPPELIALIFHHALPPPTTANFAPRAALLRSISLLSHAWREFGQAELFAHPVVRADSVGRGGVQNTTALLLSTLRLNPRLRKMVKMLYVGRTKESVGDRGRWRAAGVRELIEECEGITKLGVESLFGFDLTWLNGLTNLTSLSLHNVEGTLSATLTLPKLTSLSLSHCELWEEDWAALISPTTLPALRALGSFGQPSLSTLLAHLPSDYLAQLDALFTNPLSERSWTGRTASGHAIPCPVLWECLSPHALEHLFASERDTPVKHLRCRGWRGADELGVLADYLTATAEGELADLWGTTRQVAALETVWLSAEEVEGEEAREAVERIERACKAAKIELVRDGDGDRKDSLVSERFWARAREVRVAKVAAEQAKSLLVDGS